MFCHVDSMALLTDIFLSSLCQSYGILYRWAFDETLWLYKMVSEPIQLRREKLPRGCLHWAVCKNAGTSLLAKSFSWPEFAWFTLLGTSKIFPVRFNGGYRRGTTAASSIWLYLGLQHSWNSLTRPLIHASSSRSLCGTARPTFWASAVTLTTIFTSCYWNTKIYSC
jgi:hypothetical protein